VGVVVGCCWLEGVACMDTVVRVDACCWGPDMVDSMLGMASNLVVWRCLDLIARHDG